MYKNNNSKVHADPDKKPSLQICHIFTYNMNNLNVCTCI